MSHHLRKLRAALTLAAAFALGCGGRPPLQRDAVADSLPGDAAADLARGDASDTRTITLNDAAPADAPDAGACPNPWLGIQVLVCFGADPAPYTQYLEHVDGGPTVGRCPAPGDFSTRNGGEGGYAYFACGPLSAAMLAAALDAGSSLGDGGSETCCFIVTAVPGV